MRWKRASLGEKSFHRKLKQFKSLRTPHNLSGKFGSFNRFGNEECVKTVRQAPSKFYTHDKIANLRQVSIFASSKFQL